MKRLRTLSIARPEALDRRMYKSAWVGSYWLAVRRRKQRERQVRLLRHVYGLDAPVEAAARKVH